ncbi:MAG: tetratricopeptide repeat protein [Nitrospinae bacterium]|nr:tetratricopeptide repeat protein [Nitrospinota bacterium]
MAHYKRITKREDIKGPDEFVGFWTKAYHWIDDRKEEAVKAVVGVVLLVVVIFAAVGYKQNRDARASAELFKILKDAPRVDDDQFANGTGKVQDALKGYVESYGSTRNGRIGLLYEANYVYHDGKSPDAAEKLYKQITDGGQRDFVAQLAALGLASCYQNQGKYDAAVSTLEKFRGDSSFKEEMDFMVAHNFELSKNKEGALKEYKQFLSKYPASKNLNAVKEGIARLS